MANGLGPHGWRPSGRVLAVGSLLAGVAAAAALIFFLVIVPSRTGDISHPNAKFQAPAPVEQRRHRRAPETFVWPFYGYTANRDRVLGASLHPPYRRRWKRRGRALLEFPPVIRRGFLYELDDNAVLTAINARTGKTHWRRRLGQLAAASPAIGGRRVFVDILSRRGNADAGRALALDARTGKLLWSRDLPSRAESSPVVSGGNVYFGSQDGTLYALRERGGREVWTYHAGGAIKGGPALVHGTLYFGSYGGGVYAVRARDGRQVWSVGTSGAAFGLSAGNFYATPAVAFGRIYLGNTDGRMYSFQTSDGKLAWAKQTGSYVYGSAAVTDVPRLGPTVYFGSYDGHLYALDARSGGVRWVHNAGGKISGGTSIVGKIVYFSNLAAKTTAGLNARTGRQVFHWPEGSFNPVISDGRRIYLAGYGDLWGLAPKAGRTRRRRAG